MKPCLGVFIGFLMAVNVVCGVASPVPSVRIVLPGDAGPLAKRAGDILGRQIAERCGAEVVTGGKAAWSVELGIEAGIGTEGFEIADGPGNTVRILGNDERGLLYGVGKFLRSSRYDRGGFTLGAWRGTSVPKCPIRGIYLATHFNNYYEAASPEELERYVEDLSLWGFNLLALTYPHWQYTGYGDPAARRMGDHLRRIMRVAKQVVREYAAFEFSPDVADDVVKVVEIFERNHLRGQLGPSAEEAFERVHRIEARLTPRARAAWRWRIVYLRALIDREMFRTHGRPEGKALRDAFRELKSIYHAERAHSMPIRPPQIGDAGAK